MLTTQLLGLSIVSGLLLIATPATADRDTYKDMQSPERSGFTMGASFGRGSIEVDCGTCGGGKLTEALSVSAHAGYMLTPNLAIVGEHWSVRYAARGGALFDDSQRHLVAQHMSTVAAQLFVTDSVWLKAGVGVGWHISDGDYAKNFPKAPSSSTPMTVASQSPIPQPTETESLNTGGASFVALGWEFAHNRNFAADIQFRVGATQQGDKGFDVYNTGLNVGFNWY